MWTPRRQAIIEAIQRHGPLHRPAIYALTKHLAHDETGLRKLLVAMYRDGDLVRIDKLSDPRSFIYYKVYGLSPKAERELGAKRTKYTQAISGGDTHAFMTSCITASIEAEVMKHPDWSYITQEEILSGAPEATRNAKNPLAIPCDISYAFKSKERSKKVYAGKSINGRIPNGKVHVTPDQIFGIRYGDLGERYFALEADLGHEPERRENNLEDTSILLKQLGYKDVLTHHTFKAHFDIPNLFPLFVTTIGQDYAPFARRDNFAAQLLDDQLYPNGSKFFLHAAISGFDPYRYPPTHTYPQLFKSPYIRAGNTPFDIGNPAKQ